MKNILKQFMIIAVGTLLMVSCDYDETNFDALTNSPDPSATFYVQFKNAQQSFEVDIDPASGDTEAEIQATITVAILGLPLANDLSVNLSVDPASTATPNMYVLGSSTVVIPAGSVSATTTITSVSENMPVGEVVTLVLNVDAGANNAPAGTTLTYNLLRPAPCSPIPGDYTVVMTDSYGDGWQTTNGDAGAGITVTVDGVLIAEIGMCSPYAASDFPCSGVPATSGFTNATATVTIPEGSLSAIWTFPGDWYGEIGYTITAPNGTSYSVSTGNGVAGVIPLEFCLE